MIIKLEPNASGKFQVRLFTEEGRAVAAKQDGPRKPGVCVFCKRAKLLKEDTLCEGLTMNCEQHVWMESRKVRGLK